jgi:hypothetical protein
MLPACGGDEGGSGDAAAAALCVKLINDHRASVSLPPYTPGGADAESCANGEAATDAESGTAHAAFRSCGETAQNECPDWMGPPGQMIAGCLQLMWNEGPGDDVDKHGHYNNMASTSFTTIACGFFTLKDGKVWAVQNFK